MKAAIAAKEAQEAADATAKAAKVAQAAAAAPLKVNSKVRKGVEFRGDVYMKDGVPKIWCLKCKEDVNYGGWSGHCSRRHPVQGSDDAEERNKDNDDNKRKDDDTDQPKGSDAGHLCAGVGDAVSTQKPKDGYQKKEAESAAPRRRKKASSGDQGTQKQKTARVAPKRKVKPG